MRQQNPMDDVAVVDIDEYFCEKNNPYRMLWLLIIGLAIKDGASEVRLDSLHEDLKLSYIVGGICHQLLPPPPHLAPAMAQEMKLMAEPERPRSTLSRILGRFVKKAANPEPRPRESFQLQLGDQRVEVGLSMKKSDFGDSVVLHLPQNEAARNASEALDRFLEPRNRRTSLG